MYPPLALQGILRIRFQRGGTAGKEEKRNGEQNTGKEFLNFFAIGTPPDEIYCSILAEWEQGGVYGRKVTKLDKAFAAGTLILSRV